MTPEQAEMTATMAEYEQLVAEILLAAKSTICEHCEHSFQELNDSGQFNLRNAKDAIAHSAEQGCKYSGRISTDLFDTATLKDYPDIMRRLNEGKLDPITASKYTMTLHIKSLLNAMQNMIVLRVGKQLNNGNPTQQDVLQILNDESEKIRQELYSVFTKMIQDGILAQNSFMTK